MVKVITVALALDLQEAVAVAQELQVKTVTQEELIWAVTVEAALIILALTEAVAVVALLGLTMHQALPVVELGAVATVVQLILPK